MIDLNRIYVGDCIEVMKTWPENFVDTILTDPPYGIRFMGKAWDGADIEKMVQSKRRKTTDRSDLRGGRKSIDNRAMAAGTYDQSLTGNAAFQVWCTEWAAAALRIAKPGAMMLVFGGTRTFHRMTAGIEDAGWEIRDCLMWLYGSGFPKSHNFKEGAFKGWGTALKPAWEPIILAMKPIEGTFAQNAEKWGVAGINIDGTRIKTDGEDPAALRRSYGYTPNKEKASDSEARGVIRDRSDPLKKALPNPSDSLGRWPANLLLDEEASAILDQQTGPLSSGDPAGIKAGGQGNAFGKYAGGIPVTGYGDRGGASRFFYVAKASRRERNEGCEALPDRPLNWSSGEKNPGSFQAEGTKREAQNFHPTVKPLDLMKYLCNLTRTPGGGIVLDPFAGSGTTLRAAEFHNRPWIGIEMNPEYAAIAEKRIAAERAQTKMAI